MPTLPAEDGGEPRAPRVTAVPRELAWLCEEAGLRPVAVARVVGLAPGPFAAWAAGTWAPAPADVPLAAVLAALHARLSARLAAERDRRRWWTHAQRPLGWLAPAEVLRRGKVGEVLMLVAELADVSRGDGEDE